MEATKKTIKVSRDVCKAIYEPIRINWGNGFKSLGTNLQRALVAERVLHVFTGRPDEVGATSEVIMVYLNAMYEYAGIED